MDNVKVVHTSCSLCRRTCSSIRSLRTSNQMILSWFELSSNTACTHAIKYASGSSQNEVTRIFLYWRNCQYFASLPLLLQKFVKFHPILPPFIILTIRFTTNYFTNEMSVLQMVVQLIPCRIAHNSNVNGVNGGWWDVECKMWDDKRRWWCCDNNMMWPMTNFRSVDCSGSEHKFRSAFIRIPFLKLPVAMICPADNMALRDSIKVSGKVEDSSLSQWVAVPAFIS